MNTISSSPKKPNPAKTRHFPGVSVITVFALCCVIALAAVGWRAWTRVQTAKAKARLEATVRSSALELQFSQGAAVAEVLGTLVKQGGGTLANFQKVAAELVESHPGVVSIELQPGGVVREVFPKTGTERILGLNVFTDPTQRAGAAAAMQKRTLTVTGPISLFNGEAGLLVRTPVFLRGRDGREALWGFVAVSTRLADGIAKAGLEELWANGYQYLFYAPATGGQKGAVIKAHGNPAVSAAAQVPVQVLDAEFRIAVEPRGGWVNYGKVALELAAALFIAGLFSLLVHVVRSRREVEAEVAEQTRRINREAADRTHAQEEYQSAKQEAANVQAELNKARAALALTKTSVSELQGRLEATVRAATDREQADQVKLEQADLKCSELQSRLAAAADAAEKTAKENELEVEQLRVDQQQTQKSIKELQTRLEAEQRSAAEGAGIAQARLRKAESTIAELQAHLDAAARSMKEAADTHAAKTAKLEESIRDLDGRLGKVGELEARIVELTDSLRTAEEKLAAQRQAAEKVNAELELVPEESISSQPEKIEIRPAVEVVPVEEPKDLALTPEPEPSAPVESQSAAVETPPLRLPEPPAPEKAAPKRKRGRREGTLDLFGGEPVKSEVNQSESNAEPSASSVEELKVPVDETPQPEEVAAVDSGKTESTETVQAKVETPSTQAPEKASREEPEAADHDDMLEFGGIDNLGTSAREVQAAESADPKLVRQFCERHALAPEKIRDSLVQGDTAAAVKILSGLLTGAEAVGALVVQTAAGRLQHAIREGADPTEIEFMWADLHKVFGDLSSSLKTEVRSKEEKSSPARAHKPAQLVNGPQFRKAVHLIIPLLAGEDPGAQECFKDNREIFRSGFTVEGFEEFARALKKGEFQVALDQLRKTARKHGLSV